jgi:hypothetical protein
MLQRRNGNVTALCVWNRRKLRAGNRFGRSFREPNRIGPAIASGWLAGGAFLAIRRRNLCNSRVSGSDLAADAAKIRWERNAIAISLRHGGGDGHFRVAGLLLGITAFRDTHAECSHEMAAHDRWLGEIF